MSAAVQSKPTFFQNLPEGLFHDVFRFLQPNEQRPCGAVVCRVNQSTSEWFRKFPVWDDLLPHSEKKEGEKYVYSVVFACLKTKAVTSLVVDMLGLGQLTMFNYRFHRLHLKELRKPYNLPQVLVNALGGFIGLEGLREFPGADSRYLSLDARYTWGFLGADLNRWPSIMRGIDWAGNTFLIVHSFSRENFTERKTKFESPDKYPRVITTIRKLADSGEWVVYASGCQVTSKDPLFEFDGFNWALDFPLAGNRLRLLLANKHPDFTLVPSERGTRTVLFRGETLESVAEDADEQETYFYKP